MISLHHIKQFLFQCKESKKKLSIECAPEFDFSLFFIRGRITSPVALQSVAISVNPVFLGWPVYREEYRKERSYQRGRGGLIDTAKELQTVAPPLTIS